jgi:hypothetical protein
LPDPEQSACNIVEAYPLIYEQLNEARGTRIAIRKILSFVDAACRIMRTELIRASITGAAFIMNRLNTPYFVIINQFKSFGASVLIIFHIITREILNAN